MKNKNREKNNDNKLNGFLAGMMLLSGLLLGSLISAVAMLLLAPQSGKKTRRQIRRKARALRAQAGDALDERVAQVRATANQVTAVIQEQAEALQQRGQDVVDQQKERWAPVVDAGKTAVNNGN
jgi:gas vesicle protein